jgi:hypothetical protein
VRGTEELSSFFGMVAAFLYIVGNVYYPARLIAKKFFMPWSPQTAMFFRKYLKTHVILNIIALVALTIHAHYADERNFALTLCFIATVWLTIAGALMHYRVLPEMRKQLRLLHIQHFLFVIWLLLIIVGHMIE